MPKEFDKERAHNTFYSMLQTDRLHRSVVEDFLCKLGIHRSQHLMLMFLSRHENCPSQKAIADHFGISSAAVAVTLKKLEENGYVVRNTVKEDTRFNSITLSDKGKELVSKSKQLFETADVAMFSDFSQEEYEIFERCIGKMMSGLTQFKNSRNNDL